MLFGEIASGGMATVHLGRLVGVGGFGRTVAVKRLHAKYAKDPEFSGMLLDEARIVARIQHPNVVQTLDVVQTGPELFLVMEYVHGEAFGRLLRASRESRARGEPPSHAIVASVVAGVLHGLQAAHEARSETGEPLGIVHRDVSPQNVLVGADGVARLVDFGVAKAIERVQTTREGQIKGKLAYMAPEQLMDKGVDARTDVYAAGVMLWEALAGARLFHADNEGAIIAKVLGQEVLPPSSVDRHVPRALDVVVMRAIARDPATRFGSAREMALALEACGVAGAGEVGAWVQRLAARPLADRAARIAEMEQRMAPSSMRMARDVVESLKSMPAAAADGASGPPSPPSPSMSPAASPSMSPSAGSGSRPRDPTLWHAATHAAVSAPPRAPASAADAAGRRTVLVAATIVAALVAVSAIAATVLLLVTRARAGATSTSTAKTTTTATTTGTATGTATASSTAAAAAAAPAPECPKDMIRIPGGKFFMGRDDGLPFEKPEHQVALDPFCIDRTEVTVEAYVACSDAGECKRAGTTNTWPDITDHDKKVFDPLCNVREPVERARHPINCVDWDDAVRFCKAQGKRLPTEAEWEFAARGPDGRRYPWGDETPSGGHLNACGKECVAWGKAHKVEEKAMYAEDDGYATTAPVGSFPPGRSRYGVDDVVGNVWEWVADRYGPYTTDDQTNPQGPDTGDERVIRGGAWNGADPAWVRPTFRYKNAPTVRSYGIGFRCAK